MAETDTSPETFPQAAGSAAEEDDRLAGSLAKTQPVRIDRDRRVNVQAVDSLLENDPELASSIEKTQPIRRSLPSTTSSLEKTQPVRRSRPLASNLENTQPIRAVGLKNSLWRNAWRRMLGNPEAIIGMIILAFLLFLAVFSDLIAQDKHNETHIGLYNLPPAWVERNRLGISGDPRFLLGTDLNGRDLFSSAVYGMRTSLALGLGAVPFITLIGLLAGLLAGYAGGRLDNLIMRITDVFYAFPPLMLCILVVLTLRSTPMGDWLDGMFMLFAAFILVGWAGGARLVRSSVLSIKGLEYIEAARCLGVPGPRLVFKHILPNCLSPLLVWITLMIPQFILTEAVLTYLEIIPGQAGDRMGFFASSLGGMILTSRRVIHIQPIQTIIPAVCVGLISIAFTILGDSLRDALDPENAMRGKI